MMLPIRIFLILFLGLSTTTATQVIPKPLGMESGAIKTSQIKVTGFPAGDPRLERLRYNCCKDMKGELSGFCLNKPNDATPMQTIEITFDYPTKIINILVQEPVDHEYGYLKYLYISYKTHSSDPKPTVFLNKHDKAKIFALSRDGIIMKNEPTVKKLYLQIRKDGGNMYEKNPCLRLELMGCPQTACPAMDQDPVLTTTTEPSDYSVTFYCSVRLRKGFRHIADWVLNNTVIKTEASTEQLVSTIHQRELYPYLPAKHGLKCRVTICYDANCAVARDSNILTPTAKIDSGKLTLSEGKPGKEIVISLQGPPVLFLNPFYAAAHGTKYIRLEAAFSSNVGPNTCSKVAVVVHQKHGNRECGPLVTDWTLQHNITVKAVADGHYSTSTIKKKGSIYLRHFKEDGGSVNLVDENIVNSIDVEVTNSDRWGVCYSHNDPHLATFDGLPFEGQSEGEFIAYLNGDNQVNGYFVNCGAMWGGRSSATCNCGVAVKAADEVVVLSSCPQASSKFELNNPKKKRHGFFKVYTFLNGDPKKLNGTFSSGMRVYSHTNGWEYYVTLPTGTYVRVSYGGDMINFIIVPSSLDWETSSGYCGHYDGSITHDQRNRDGSVYTGYRHRFVEVWRQSKSCSLFHGAKKHTPNPESYCRCVIPSSHTYICDKKFDADPCPPGGADEVTEELIDNFVHAPGPKACSPPTTKGKRSVDNEMGNLHRMKRAVPTDPKTEDDVYNSFVFNASYVYKEPTWPTDSGWTEAKARSFCENYLLKKDAVKNCKTYTGKTYTDEINSCVFDIKATDSTTFAESTLAVITSSCLAEVEKEPPNVVDLKGGLKRTVLLSSLCLDNCNNKGTCKEGQCVCNDGYYGSVCSLTKDTPPTISYIPRDGLCNMRSRNCSRSEVFGKDIIKSSDLKCRLTPYHPETKIRDDSGQFMTTARYINFNLVLCPHDGKYGNFLIALSNNNGKDYSDDELLFMAYDSACFKCNIDQDEKKGNCTQLKTGCFIGSKCYLPEELDANSNCRICDPDRNVNNWSLNTEFSNCTKSDDDHTVAIIAGVSSAVAAILLIVIAVVVHKKCRRVKISPPSALDINSEAKNDDPEKDQATVKQETRRQEQESEKPEKESEIQETETRSEEPENRMETPINVAETTTGRKVWYTDTFSQFGQIQIGTRAKTATGKTKPKLGSRSRSSRRK